MKHEEERVRVLLGLIAGDEPLDHLHEGGRKVGAVLARGPDGLDRQALGGRKLVKDLCRVHGKTSVKADRAATRCERHKASTRECRIYLRVRCGKKAPLTAYS
jgi:hypothetical protein